jgi:hypothetical protein
MCIARNGAMKNSAKRTLMFFSTIKDAVQYCPAIEEKSGEEMLKSKICRCW